MPIPFSQTARAIGVDQTRSGTWLKVSGITLVLLWVVWFFSATVTLYETSRTARVEAGAASYPVETRAGIVETVRNLDLNRVVRSGDTLLDLRTSVDSVALSRALEQVTALGAKRRALQSRLTAERAAASANGSADTADVRVSQFQAQEADARASAAEASMNRLTDLANRTSLVAPADIEKARADARALRAAASALRSNAEQHELRRRETSFDRSGQASLIEGDIADADIALSTELASVATLRERISTGHVRAPVDGQIVQVVPVRPGMVLTNGSRVAVIASSEPVRVIGEMTPQVVGRVQIGDIGQLSVTGFARAQYGVVTVRVVSIATEPLNGLLRVECVVLPSTHSAIHLQRGMEGSLQIAVGRTTIANMLLRNANETLFRRNAVTGRPQ